MTLETDMILLGQAAQTAGAKLRLADEVTRNTALRAMAKHIRNAKDMILAANTTDMEAAAGKGLSAPLLDRLKLDANRVEGIAEGLEAIAALPGPPLVPLKPSGLNQMAFNFQRSAFRWASLE